MIQFGCPNAKDAIEKKLRPRWPRVGGLPEERLCVQGSLSCFFCWGAGGWCFVLFDLPYKYMCFIALLFLAFCVVTCYDRGVLWIFQVAVGVENSTPPRLKALVGCVGGVMSFGVSFNGSLGDWGRTPPQKKQEKKNTKARQRNILPESQHAAWPRSDLP